MDITSFVLGVLTVIAVIFVAAVVVGLLKIYKLQKQVKDLTSGLHSTELSINDRLSQEYEWLSKTLDERHREALDQINLVHKDSMAYTDSRIDKLLQAKKDQAQTS